MPANESGGSQASEAPEHASELSAIIVSELRETYGIKYRKEKKPKPAQDKTHRRRIFNVALDKLELTDVILANGGVTQVPLFVSDACQRILEQVHTEGLFRKAGSTARQREIRAHLEAGIRLGQSHHVIDVANVLKLFFRELPEPLLAPGAGQEAILRCLLCGDRRVHALLLSVLLLPTLALNTLTFFMQFLHTVSQHAAQNRMTSENLSIIFAPGLMPLPEIVPQRLESHCRVIRMLIEHAADIGTVPRYILDRVQRRVAASAAAQQSAAAAHAAASTGGRGRSKSLAAVCEETSGSTTVPETEKKKKKRRSGMFNGLRKIVGSAIGSTDELDTTPEFNPSTPCLTKTAKKRKVLDAGGFSAKKKKDVLALLPENGAMLPSTPMCTKNPKKSRLSLGGRRNDKKTTASTTFLPDDQPPQPPMERRWSVVGAPWSRKKTTTTTSSTTANTTRSSRLDDIFGSRKSMAAVRTANSRDPSPLPAARPRADSMDGDTYVSSTYLEDLHIGDGGVESDFMRISKSEYEAIKERVSAIETRISQEFGAVVNASRLPPADDSTMSVDVDGPAAVLSKYERTLEQTEATNAAVVADSPATDQLAKRLSRELKIRRSVEHSAAVIRSPSARKIGTMRRRSRESAVRLSRNFSWHVGNNSTAATASQPVVQQHRPVAITMPQSSDECDAAAAAVAAASTAAAAAAGQQMRANLKRGRPNTVQTGLRHPSPTKKGGAMVMPMPMEVLPTMVSSEASGGAEGSEAEQWTSGEKFFAGSGTPVAKQQLSQPQTPVPVLQTNQENHPQTPYFVSTVSLSEMKTPMLPPRRPLNFRTPLTLHNAAISSATTSSSSATKTPMLPPRSTQKLSHTPAAAATSIVVNRALATPMSAEGLTGRASIARLRSQNAGHVAAKARLFNAFVSETGDNAAAGAGLSAVSTAPVIGPASTATSIAAAVQPILQHAHQRRQSAAFALNNMRQMHTNSNSNSNAPQASGRPSIAATKLRGGTSANVASPRKSMTPSGVASRRSAAKNHLNGIHRRQKLRLARSPIKRSSPMRLKHLIDGAADTVQASPGRRQQRQPQQQRTPKTKANFRTAMDSIVNGSPQCGRPTNAGGGGGQTPVKVLRHSPRLQSRAGGSSAVMY